MSNIATSKEMCRACCGIRFCISNGIVLEYSSLTNRITPISVLPEAKNIQLQQIQHVWSLTPTSIQPDISFAEYWNRLNGRVKNLTLEVTEQCNCRCTYCLYSGSYDNRRVHSPKKMSPETMLNALKYFHGMNKCCNSAHVAFYGGEALLEFELIRNAVFYCKDLFRGKKVSFSISSNGLLLNNECVEWLLCHPEVSVVITMNGPFHDKQRRTVEGHPTLKQTLENLATIKKNYWNVWEQQISFICNATTLDEIRPLRAFYLRKIGKLPVTITNIVAEHGNTAIASIARKEKMSHVVNWKSLAKEFLKTGDDFLNVLFRSRLRSIHNRQIVGNDAPCYHHTCLPFINNMFITTEGFINLCERNPLMFFGDVTRGIQKNKIESLITNAYRAFGLKCGACWARRLCSVCYANIDGLPDKKCTIPDELCKRERANILEDLRLYCEIQISYPNLLHKIVKNNY